ncbi:MAG: hypothetical protein AAF690_20870 [Acidobacteriota bacterium]
MNFRIPTSFAASVLLASAAFSDDGHRHAQPVHGLSGLHHPITTESPGAQRFFDQGLELAYGFNHAAAADAFREAVRLDPDCAMCHWGIALVLGPNINGAMDPADNPEAFASVQRARRLAAGVTRKERDTIDALAQRYEAEPPEDRSHLDKAYADAMRRVYTKYPADLDLATLFAESLMDTTPWDYWTEDNEPRPVTSEFLAVLETVLRREPGHTGANHYLIHAVEKVRPDLGLPAAARLEMLAQGAGHLVHMGSHIYIRVGQYHDASRVNQKAIEADERFLREHGSSAVYDTYRWHNHHFLTSSTSFEGRSELALATASDLRSRMDDERMRTPGFLTLQHYWATPYFVQVRFGQWEQILEEPQPAEDLVYPNALWRFARGMAHLRQGRAAAAVTELETLESLARSPVLDEVTIWDLNTSRQIVDIAQLVLRGEIAAARGDLASAVSALEKGVELEAALNYDEPPPWQFPVRQNLGAVLLEAGEPEEAEAVYRADLEAFPWNGWSLRGLARSLEDQGRAAEAAQAARDFARAWQHADVTIEGSRF